MHDLLELLRVKDSALRIFDLDVTNTHGPPIQRQAAGHPSRPRPLLPWSFPPSCPEASTAASWSACGKAYRNASRSATRARARCLRISKPKVQLVPDRMFERIHRYFEISSPVALGL